MNKVKSEWYFYSWKTREMWEYGNVERIFSSSSLSHSRSPKAIDDFNHSSLYSIHSIKSTLKIDSRTWFVTELESFMILSKFECEGCVFDLFTLSIIKIFNTSMECVFSVVVSEFVKSIFLMISQESTHLSHSPPELNS